MTSIMILMGLVASVVMINGTPITERECYYCSSPLVQTHAQKWKEIGFKELPPSDINCNNPAAHHVNTTKCTSPCFEYYFKTTADHTQTIATIRGCQQQITGVTRETDFFCENGQTHGILGINNTAVIAFSQMILCGENNCNDHQVQTPYPNCNKQSKQIKCHNYITIDGKEVKKADETCTGNYCGKYVTDVTMPNGTKVESVDRACIGVNTLLHDTSYSMQFTFETYKYSQKGYICGEENCNSAMKVATTSVIFAFFVAVLSMVVRV